MQSEKTETKPVKPTPEQQYAHLCAQLGERHYVASKLAQEIAVLSQKIDELKAKAPAPGGA